MGEANRRGSSHERKMHAIASERSLAQNPPNLPTLPIDACKRIASLAYAIANEANARNGMTSQPPWSELSESTQDQSARGVLRTVQAMVLLGMCEPPA